MRNPRLQPVGVEKVKIRVDDVRQDLGALLLWNRILEEPRVIVSIVFTVPWLLKVLELRRRVQPVLGSKVVWLGLVEGSSVLGCIIRRVRNSYGGCGQDRVGEGQDASRVHFECIYTRELRRYQESARILGNKETLMRNNNKAGNNMY